MLKMKSNASYKHLRNYTILPLASASTIRKLISSSNCHFGFNQLALENIVKALKEFGKDDPAKYVCLMWDQIHLVKSGKFNTRQRVLDGIVNYGSDFKDLEANFLADSFFVFRHYNQSWIQPIASFATHGAVPASVIHRIVLKAITSSYTREEQS